MSTGDLRILPPQVRGSIVIIWHIASGGVEGHSEMQLSDMNVSGHHYLHRKENYAIKESLKTTGNFRYLSKGVYLQPS